MGSKNKIVQWVIDNLPKANSFVDLFAGGCSVTHAAILSGKYKNFILNDITDAPSLFRDCIEGKLLAENRWISRDDFFRLRETDAYARICFSFGNNQTEYAYSRWKEPYKKAYHYAIFFKDYSLFHDLNIYPPMIQGSPQVRFRQLRQWLIQHRAEVVQAYTDYCRQELNYELKDWSRVGDNEAAQYLNRLNDLTRLQSAERLQRMQDINADQPMQIYRGDYRDVEIPLDAAVYADPPYIGTHSYLNDFNHREFYDWLRHVPIPVYVSEYTMPRDFVRFAAIKKVSSLSATNNKVTTEGMYVHRRFAHLVKDKLAVPHQLVLFDD